ncbi:MAG: 50S ribosomal protein L29 [Bacilli bacterium]|nr:50S ribosomal protein L29 [Bacilli bacterium]
MDMKEIRKLSDEQITKKITECKDELFTLRFAASTGNLEKPHRVKELRHTVARLKTVLKEREGANEN